MIDDELLQELLGKASGLYNNGEYGDAIEAWKEALKVDPGSQKAREGIQMATLLLTGSETVDEIQINPEPEPPAAADGASPEGEGGADLEARLDHGIQRVRDLLNERRYSEAVEGARSLVPMDPDSEDVQRLVEEAQQAFEAAPFIEEHLTLARELASQDRLDEAETECRKVFALDRGNPEAHALIADLRRRARTERKAQAPAAAPEDVGGMTVKMDLSQVLDDLPMPESQEPEPPARPEPAAPARSAVPAADEALAEPLSSEMFDFELDLGGSEASHEEPEAAPTSAPQESVAASSPGSEEDAPPAPKSEEPAEDLEIVDADTVVPPSVRLVPRTEEPQPDTESWLERLETSGQAPKTKAGAVSKPDPPRAAPSKPASVGSGWEQELETLNLESGEQDILGHNAARVPASPASAVDSDLSCLLEGDLGSPSAGMGAPEEKPQAPPPPRVRDEEAPQKAPRARKARREEPEEAPPPETGSRRSVSLYFGLLGVLLLAGAGAAWWFFFQPKTAAGRVLSAVTPPSASSGEKPGPEQGPLPTPIGSTSREPVKTARIGNGDAAIGRGAAAGAHEAAPAQAAPQQVAPPAPPVVPPPRPKSPEEIRAEVARHMSEGRRFTTAEKWREARDEFAAVIALDPVNFQAKELLDQTQQRVDQETKVQQDLQQAKSAFDDKDYQGALWKLYRLPRDPRLGDIDRAIRNSWFNWAVMGLKNGDATNALQKLSEVLSVDPEDADATKLQEVAERYASKPKDKIFYSFVDTLKYRAFDQK